MDHHRAIAPIRLMPRLVSQHHYCHNGSKGIYINCVRLINVAMASSCGRAACCCGGGRAAVFVHIEKFIIFRTIFWVSLRDKKESTGSTGAAPGEALCRRWKATEGVGAAHCERSPECR